jgi:hypothetical protein
MTIGEKAFGFLSGLFKQQVPLDPAVFGDPLAIATQWTPLVRGGMNFCSHRLLKRGPASMEFKTTLGLKLFCIVFFVMGALFAFCPMGAICKQYGGFHVSMLMSPLFGLVFCAVGFFLYYGASAPIVFDMNRNSFTKGRRQPGETVRKISGVFADLSRVKALQVLSEYCRGNKSSYYSYELNLVLDDASRLNVVDHGNLKALREDARTLGQFLGVSVWDALASREESVNKDPGPFQDKWA